MDVNLAIAIAGILGTLIGSAASIYGTYIVQSKASEREKKWAREADEIKRKQEIEDEQRRVKRELLSSRLDIIEEVATIRMFLAGLAVKEEQGDPIESDKAIIEQKRKRMEEISGHAWACVLAYESQGLKESYQAIGAACYDAEQEGSVDEDVWKKAREGFVALVKVIDDMKTKV